MKGLILNNFYSMEDNIKLSFIISIFLSASCFILTDIKFISMIISIQIFVVVSNITTSLKVDEASSWNKMEVTLPVKRSDIITAKYISLVLLLILGVSFSLLTLVVLKIKEIELNIIYLVQGYTYGISLVIATVSALYPIILKFGSNKGDIMLAVSIGIAIAMRFFIWILLNIVSANSINFNSSEVGVVYIMVSGLLFILSYIISRQIYKNKSFF